MTTITLAPLAPFARLLKMSDNTAQAFTSLLLAGTGRQSKLDAAGGCTLAVSLSDPGYAAAPQGFATALLQAGGGPGSGSPVPMLLSVSLAGGFYVGIWSNSTPYTPGQVVTHSGDEWRSLVGNTGSAPVAGNANWARVAYDFHRLVQKPLRDTRPNALRLTESGEDIWTEYGKIPAGGGRMTLVGCSLADVLGGLPGQIIPLNTTDVNYQEFISSTHKVPFECGLLYPAASLFQDIPGDTAWDAGALARLQFVAVLPTTGFSTAADLAFTLPTDIDAWKDTQQHAVAVLVEKLGAVVLSGDTTPLGSRGHLVADCSDAALNVAQALAGVVCDGTPAVGSLGGTHGLSNARAAGFAVARSVLIGSVGSPSGLTFIGGEDMDPSQIIDEATTARILAGVTLEPDLTVLHGACSFDGGASDAGFPAGGKITALTQLNRAPSGSKDAFTDCLPIVGINVSEKTGGVYYYDTLGQLIPVNKSQSIPVLDLQVDTVNKVIDIATPHGVYHRTTDVTDTTSAWVPVGGLTARVVRLALPVVGSTAFLWAQVSDPQNRRLDGVYVYIPSLSTPGQGFNGWVRRLITPNLLENGDGFVSTDGHSFFYIDKSDQNGVFLWDSTASPPTRKLTLPAGVNALRLDRVIGAGGSPVDTVYVTVSDGNGSTTLQAAYYTKFASGAWQPLVPTSLAVGQSLQVSRFVAVNETINGLNYVAVIACTGNGLYYSVTNTPTSAADWKPMNAQSGLAGINVTNVSAGAAQTVLGQTMNRMYATTDTDLYMSSNGGVQFDNVTHTRVDRGPYFKALVQAATSAPPTNSVQTVGTMASSPIGLGADTHVQVTSYLGYVPLPPTWYRRRRLNGRGAWQWELRNPDCPFAALQEDQLSDIVADETQDALTASSISAAVELKWLGENSTEVTTLKVPSFFTQQGAALEKLQPTQLVHLTYTGTIPQRAPSGEIVATPWVSFESAPFSVIDHAWALAGRGNSFAATQTTLSSILRSKPLTPQDMATAFQRQLTDLKVRATGRGRH